LMDEPFSALDPLIRSQLQDELISLQQQLNKTIIFVSHDLDEALKIGSKIAIMESGKIIQYDKPENIVLKPENDYVSEFVAHTNPLNVLCGHSLMKPLKSLQPCHQGFVLDEATQTCMQIQNETQLISVTRQGEHLPLYYLKEKEAKFEFSPNQIVVAPPEISMREALDITYHTGQPLLLGSQNNILGMLSGREFYHALLGKHFQAVH
jgi:glycine betaine/proline transport system ATP-binding protein